MVISSRISWFSSESLVQAAARRQRAARQRLRAKPSWKVRNFTIVKKSNLKRQKAPVMGAFISWIQELDAANELKPQALSSPPACASAPSDRRLSGNRIAYRGG